MRRINRITIRLTDEELAKLKRQRDDFRAFSLADAARECICQCYGSQMAAMAAKNQENKESSKENKENSPSLEKNAHTHARDLNFFVSQITEDAGQRSLAEEFLRGRLAAGEDLEQRGAAELRRHFGRWLPKYQAKMEIAARRNGVLQDQNLVKREREAKAAEQQRQANANLLASQTPEAQAERDRVCAKFGKPWKKRN